MNEKLIKRVEIELLTEEQLKVGLVENLTMYNTYTHLVRVRPELEPRYADKIHVISNNLSAYSGMLQLKGHVTYVELLLDQYLTNKKPDSVKVRFEHRKGLEKHIHQLAELRKAEMQEEDTKRIER